MAPRAALPGTDDSTQQGRALDSAFALSGCPENWMATVGAGQEHEEGIPPINIYCRGRPRWKLCSRNPCPRGGLRLRVLFFDTKPCILLRSKRLHQLQGRWACLQRRSSSWNAVPVFVYRYSIAAGSCRTYIAYVHQFSDAISVRRFQARL